MKIGDKVKVISLENTYESFGVTDRMLKVNDTAIIDGIDKNEVVILGFSYDIFDLEVITDTIPFNLRNLQKAMLASLKETHLPTSLPSKDYRILWEDDGMVIGCQDIPKKDALKLADAIYKMYGEYYAK